MGGGAHRRFHTVCMALPTVLSLDPRGQVLTWLLATCMLPVCAFCLRGAGPGAAPGSAAGRVLALLAANLDLISNTPDGPPARQE